MGWFGSLDLAYKYALVFGSALAITLLAGCVKVLYDRKRMREMLAKQELEAGQKRDDLAVLNVREKDEGDLFGVRAIEAGYFGGVAQSRPGSVMSMSRPASPSGSVNSNTLIGSAKSPRTKVQAPSDGTAHPGVTAVRPSGRNAPPSIVLSGPYTPKELSPSVAELNGRRNHSAAVDMNLYVPPSPTQYDHPSRSPSPSSSEARSSGSMQASDAYYQDAHADDRYRPLGLPEHVGTPTFEAKNPYSDAQSRAASIVSKTSSRRNGPPSPPSPPAAMPALPQRVLLEGSYHPLNNAFAHRNPSSDSRPSTSHSTKNPFQEAVAPGPSRNSLPADYHHPVPVAQNLMVSEQGLAQRNAHDSFTSQYSFDLSDESGSDNGRTPTGHPAHPVPNFSRKSSSVSSSFNAAADGRDSYFGGVVEEAYYRDSELTARTAESPKFPPRMSFVRGDRRPSHS